MLRPILERRLLGEVVTYNKDVPPTRSQSRDALRHLAINILTQFQGGFDYLKDSPQLQRRSYRPPPTKKEHVLRTTTLEGSTEGTIQVAEDIFCGS